MPSEINKRTWNRKDKFRPNRAYIDQAVDEYLKRGGQIEHIKPGPDFNDQINFFDDEIDSFLLGGL